VRYRTADGVEHSADSVKDLVLHGFEGGNVTLVLRGVDGRDMGVVLKASEARSLAASLAACADAAEGRGPAVHHEGGRPN
jgi:hypothetical protein